MIVLKHLAREFSLDPYRMRMLLRDKFGIRRRWRWDEEDPQEQAELKKVRKFLSAHVAGSPKQD